MKRLNDLPARLTDHPYIFRIETLPRLYEMLKKREITFVRPSCWTDPLENIIFSATLIRNGERYEHPAARQIYASCWTSEPDSYALWQIYTIKQENGVLKKFPGVRMSVPMKELKQFSRLNPGRFYYGSMQYMWKKDLDALRNDADFIRGLRSEKISEEHLKTLLVKRKSYSYEQELRLFSVADPSCVDGKKDFLCRLKIEPETFISSLLFDPVMDRKEFRQHQERLVDEFGFKSTRVKQSTLSQANTFRFKW